jgi:opacity protein-like surface antigen
MLCVTTALAAGLTLAAAASAESAFTLRAFGGATFSGKVDGNFVARTSAGPILDDDFTFDYDNGWLVGGAAGITFRHLTIEGELAYRRADVNSLTITDQGTSNSLLDVSGHLGVVSLLGNAWYDVPLSRRLSLYGGGGVGVAKGSERFSTSTVQDADFNLDYALAWQLGAGVKYKVDDKLWVGAGYRYFAVPDLINGSDTINTFSDHSSGDYADSSMIAEIGVKF